MVTSVLSFPASCKNPASTNVALSFTNVEDEVEPVAVGAGVGAIVDAVAVGGTGTEVWAVDCEDVVSVAVAGAGVTEDVVAVAVAGSGTGGTEDKKAVAGVAAVVAFLFEESELAPILDRELETLSIVSRPCSFNRGVLKFTNCLGSLLKALIK